MNVGIVGGGAMGMLLAARLARAGHAVRIWTRTEEQAATIRAGGITLEDNESSASFRMDAEWSGALPVAAKEAENAKEQGRAWDGSLNAPILLAVKQTAIGPSLLAVLSRIAGSMSPVICLQNGIGHMETLRAALPDLAFAAAVTTEGALRTAVCAVRHTGRGELLMEPAADAGGACADEAAKAQKMLLCAMSDAGIPASLSKQIHIPIYRKLLVNAVINPLTALYGVRNGELPDEPGRRRLMEALCAETAVILAAYGWTPDDPFGEVLRVCDATAANESSMLADVRAGRTTEVDWINGGAANLARSAGMLAPLNEAVVTLIRVLSPHEPGAKER